MRITCMLLIMSCSFSLGAGFSSTTRVFANNKQPHHHVPTAKSEWVELTPPTRGWKEGSPLVMSPQLAMPLPMQSTEKLDDRSLAEIQNVDANGPMSPIHKVQRFFFRFMVITLGMLVGFSHNLPPWMPQLSSPPWTVASPKIRIAVVAGIAVTSTYRFGYDFCQRILIPRVGPILKKHVDRLTAVFWSLYYMIAPSEHQKDLTYLRVYAMQNLLCEIYDLRFVGMGLLIADIARRFMTFGV